MESYLLPVQIRLTDIDQNRHLRHSAYYDFGAMARLGYLNGHGLTTEKMQELQVGPILFREEALFKREILLEDMITVDLQMVAARIDYSRWSLRHHIVKKDGTMAAIINMDGAWMDLVKRKLSIPPPFVQKIFQSMPKANDFKIVEADKKKTS